MSLSRLEEIPSKGLFHWIGMRTCLQCFICQKNLEMPNGSTHYWYYKKGYFLEVPLSIGLSFVDWKFALGNLAGYSFHRYCDPDWDLMGTNNSEGRMANELPVVGNILFGVSSIYGSVFRRHHRSFLTHFPLVSTLIRLIFVFGIPFFLFDYFGINLIGNGWIMFHLGFVAGLSQADAIHWYLDKSFGGE